MHIVVSKDAMLLNSLYYIKSIWTFSRLEISLLSFNLLKTIWLKNNFLYNANAGLERHGLEMKSIFKSR